MTLDHPPAAVRDRTLPSAGAPPAAPVVPATGRLRPLGVDEVELRGGFWGGLQSINSSRTLGHVEHWLEREGWLANFDRATAGDLSGRQGREFSDSEIYKQLEAMAWELGARPAPDLEERFHAIVARVAAAQQPDGYIGTAFGHPGQAGRYSDLEWGHELYCMGHLFQAATARVRTGHVDDALVRVARSAADHVCATFGRTGRGDICGHPEVEVGLAELGRAIANPTYVAQAALFVERRGHQRLDDIEFGRGYFQDDVPVREAGVMRGHAVRANYLAAAAVDVAVELEDAELLGAVTTQWRTTMARRTYVTGGQGSHHQDEGFGDDYVLPPDRAYSETCAAIASNMVSWRLLLETGDATYADAMERALYNVIATAPSADGTSFFYANTLHQRTPGAEPTVDHASKRAQSSLRAPWFAVSCCPPNIARTLAAVAATFVTSDDDGLQVHQYTPMRISTTLGGEPVEVLVDTTYPDDGRVSVAIVAAPRDGMSLSLRIPEWAANATVDGIRVTTGAHLVGRRLHAGDSISIELGLEPRFLFPHPSVDAVRGCVAIVRGPEVWCVESTDLPGDADVARVVVDTGVAPRWDGSSVWVAGLLAEAPPNADWRYGTTPNVEPRHYARQDVRLTRYHSWAARGPSTMRVWVPRSGECVDGARFSESACERDECIDP